MKKLPFYFAFLFGVISAALGKSSQELRTVDQVDLQRYLGKWYEIARFHNRFERACASDITANYSLQSDGKIEVVNACQQADGKMKASKGWAKVVDSQTNAKLKVTFFWPFFGDYWVIGLDPEYRFAVISEPNRKYLWILSRTPQLDPGLYQKAIEVVRQHGLDPARLIQAPQHSN